MTIRNAVVLSNTLTVARIRDATTFSGIVKNSLDDPIERTILCYKIPRFDVPYFTVSDKTTGQWSLNINCNSNDRLVFICLGEAGENSIIFDWVHP